MPEAYSAVTWTVSELLSDIRREARIPDAAYSDSEILREANNALWTDMQRILVADQPVGAWSVVSEDLTVADDALGERSDTFLLPSFASAEGLLSVQWYDSATATSPIRLSPIPNQLEEDYRYQYGTTQGRPNFYFIRSGRIQLLPAPQSQGYVRIYYQARHPELVVTADNVIRVTGITTTSNPTVSFDGSRPANWPAFGEGSPGFSIALFSHLGPPRYYYRALVVDDPATASSVRITNIDREDVTALEEANEACSWNSGAGGYRDVYAALHGQSDVVMLPLEFRKAFAQKVASYILRQIGDEAGANSMEGMSNRSLAAANDMFVPRTRGQAQRWINRRSPLRSGIRRFRRW